MGENISNCKFEAVVWLVADYMYGIAENWDVDTMHYHLTVLRSLILATLTANDLNLKGEKF